MNKNLFLWCSFFLMTISSTSFAQTDCGSPTGISDHYKGTEAPQGANYFGDNSVFNFERINDGLQVNVNHGSSGIYSAMGVSFNLAADIENDPELYIDASANQSGSISITNPSNTDVEVYFTISSEGSPNHTANASRVGDVVTLWGGTILSSGNETYEFDFAHAVKRTWVADEAACNALSGELVGSSHCITDNNFDLTQVSGIDWSVNKAASAETSWENGPLNNVEVIFDDLVIGSCTPTTSDETEITSITTTTPAIVGQPVIIEVNASPGIGSTISSYYIEVDENGFTTNTATWTPTAAGVFFITARVTDNNGVQVEFAEEIEVFETGNHSVTLHTLNYLDNTSNCNINSGLPNNGGNSTTGTTIKQEDYLTSEGLKLKSTDDVGAGSVTWFGIPYSNIEESSCQNFFTADLGVDMSSNSILTITAQGEEGATLEFFLGGKGEYTPSTSTYNTGNNGASVIISHTFHSSDIETFVLDFTTEVNPSGAAVWEAWEGKNKIQSIGYRSATVDAAFIVKKFVFGSEPNLINEAPIVANPIQPLEFEDNFSPQFFDLYDVFDDDITADENLVFTAYQQATEIGDGVNTVINEGQLEISYRQYVDGPVYITITAIDEDGASTEMEIELLLLESNQHPIINSVTINPDPVALGDTVTISVDATDPDGTIASYLIDFDGQTSSSPPTMWVPTSAASFPVAVTVTDNEGATASDTIMVTVNPPNNNEIEIAIDNPTNSPEYTEGDEVTIYFTALSGDQPLNLENISVAYDSNEQEVSVEDDGRFKTTFSAVYGQDEFTINASNGQEDINSVFVDVFTVTRTCTLTADSASLNDISVACGADTQLTAPTATSSCYGSITGVTTSTIDFTTPGETTITWTYTDDEGETLTQDQKITVQAGTLTFNDSTLSELSISCGAETQLTAPTATSSCIGQIEATNQFNMSLLNTPGTHTITWNYNDGKGNELSQEQSITVNQVELDLGAGGILCFGAYALPQNNTTLTWTTTGAGLLTDPTQQETEQGYYIPSQSEFDNGATITFQGSITNVCGTVTDDVVIEVLEKLIVNAGVDQFSTTTSPLTLTANSSNSSSFEWRTSGTGTFGDKNAANTTYTPTQADLSVGMVKLTLSGGADNCPNAEDETLITLAPCEVTIDATIEENAVTLAATNSNDKMLTAYSWDFGDGNTGEGKEVSHLYTSAASFNINVTATTADGFCETSASESVTIIENLVEAFSIGGTASVNGAPLNDGVASLFYLAPSGNIEVLEEQEITDNGAYEFTGLKPAYYFITFFPASTSDQANSVLPTFLGDVTKWEDAEPIALTSDIEDQDVALTTFTSADPDWQQDGKDQVSGVVTFDEDFLKKADGDREVVDNPVPVQNAIITLFNSDGDLLAFTTSDAFGEFGFNDMPAGVYELRIEYLGTAVALSQTIIIDGDGNTTDQFSFKIGQEDTEGLGDIKSTTAGLINTKAQAATYSIYPNPAGQAVNISLPEALQFQDVTYSITSTNGYVVRTKTVGSDQELKLNVSELEQGVYIIQVATDKTKESYKFSKQ